MCLRKTILPQASILLLLLAKCALGKVEQTTLPEQVDRAQLICVVEISSAQSPYRGKVMQVIKKPEDFKDTEIAFRAVSDYDEDAPKLQLGEKRILLLRKNTEMAWECVAYGAQSIWPKSQLEWPYSEVHIASLEDTLETIRHVLAAGADTDAKIAEMIRNPKQIMCMVGLESLVASGTISKLPKSWQAAISARDNENQAISRFASQLIDQENAKQARRRIQQEADAGRGTQEK